MNGVVGTFRTHVVLVLNGAPPPTFVARHPRPKIESAAAFAREKP
jgi:hypothetical protein